MVPKKHYQALVDLFASIKTREEAELLLKDIFTPQEIEALCERWQLVMLLEAGMSQREIAKKLNVSISTVTRGSRALKYGSGGFDMFLKKVQK